MPAGVAVHARPVRGSIIQAGTPMEKYSPMRAPILASVSPGDRTSMHSRGAVRTICSPAASTGIGMMSGIRKRSLRTTSPLVNGDLIQRPRATM